MRAGILKGSIFIIIFSNNSLFCVLLLIGVYLFHTTMLEYITLMKCFINKNDEHFVRRDVRHVENSRDEH